MKKQKTIYHLIVDKSGSMGDCIPQTINGFNEQISKIKSLEKKYPEQEITIGLTTFNHEVFSHFFDCNPSEVRNLTRESYIVSGTTALLDAIGMVCEKIERSGVLHSYEATVVIVILTDGHENASKSYSLAEIRRTISRLEATDKWTFSFLGATLDAVAVAEQMNIKRENSVSFNKNKMNVEVWKDLNDSMETYLEKKRSGEKIINFLKKS
jgi:uncharacterized protein YegL